ncbi:MAG: hypothetical protein HQK54_04250 [Oligoflexales bacterium]|nr:hypothetical protein [Oligoflexales bacterium]
MNKIGKKTERDPARSLDFMGLVGYRDLIRQLASLNSSGFLPQVILLEGREGIGKRILAAAIASLFYCQYGIACGKCQNCRAIICNDEPDFLWIDSEKSAIKMEDVERLQNHLAFKPSASGMLYGMDRDGNIHKRSSRTAVIIDADLLTESAVNSLLKTLEEPYEHAKIIMTTSKVGNFLPTMLSRMVLRMHINPPMAKDSAGWIREELARRDIAGPCDDMILEALKLNGLSPGAALTHLLSVDKDDDIVNRKISEMIFSDNPLNILKLIEELSRNAETSVLQVAQNVEILLNRYYKFKLGMEQPSTTALSGYFTRDLDFREIEHIRKVLRDVRRLVERSKIPLNKQLVMESLFLHRFSYGEKSLCRA